MKIKIPKMQQGGGFATFTPFLSRPQAPQQGASSSKGETEETSSLLDKETYKQLITKGGLVNDVNFFVKKLAELESDPLAYLNPNNKGQALQLIAQVNELKQNKDAWVQAASVAEKSGGLSEVAVGSGGELYSKTNSGIKAITMEEYKKNRGNHSLLTVSELLNARQYDPNLVYNNRVFGVAENSIGLSKITDHIKDMMGFLSDASTDTERHYTKEQIGKELANMTGKKPTYSEQKDLQFLLEIANTPGDYYEVVTKHKSKRGSIDKALNYIWTTLGTPSQRKLQATALINGQDKPEQLIYDMLMSYTQPETVSHITPEKNPEKLGDSQSTSSKPLGAFQMFHKDKLYDPNTAFAFNDPKMGVYFRGSIGATGPLLDQKDNSIGLTTVDDLLKGYGYNRFVESDKVFFGNKKVDSYNQNNIIYDGETAAKVYMPVGKDGMPDYEAFKDFKDVYAVYEANKDSWTKERSERHFKENNYRITIDEVGGEKVIRDNASIKPFLLMYGYTNDATGLTDDNEWVKEVSSHEEKLLAPRLEQIWTVGTGKNRQNMTPQSFWGEDYYKGMVTIPYRKNATAIVDAIVGRGAMDKQYSIQDVQNNIKYSNNTLMNGNLSGVQLNRE